MDLTFAYLTDADISECEVYEAEPAPPPPQVPPPVWDNRWIDPQRCMDAIHAMCR